MAVSDFGMAFSAIPHHHLLLYWFLISFKLNSRKLSILLSMVEWKEKACSSSFFNLLLIHVVNVDIEAWILFFCL